MRDAAATTIGSGAIHVAANGMVAPAKKAVAETVAACMGFSEVVPASIAADTEMYSPIDIDKAPAMAANMPVNLWVSLLVDAPWMPINKVAMLTMPSLALNTKGRTLITIKTYIFFHRLYHHYMLLRILPVELQQLLAPYIKTNDWIRKALHRPTFDQTALKLLAKGIVSQNKTHKSFMHQYPEYTSSQDRVIRGKAMWMYAMAFLQELIGKPVRPDWWNMLPRRMRMALGVLYIELQEKQKVNVIDLKTFSIAVSYRQPVLKWLNKDPDFVVGVGDNQRIQSIEQYLKSLTTPKARTIGVVMGYPVVSGFPQVIHHHHYHYTHQPNILPPIITLPSVNDEPSKANINELLTMHPNDFDEFLKI